MGSFDYSLFIRKTDNSIPSTGAPQESTPVDRVQEYIQQNYSGSDNIQESGPEVSIEDMQQSVAQTKAEVISKLKSKPSFGLESSQEVQSAEQAAEANNNKAIQDYNSAQQTAEQNNKTAQQQTSNAEETAEYNNRAATENFEEEEQTSQENNEIAEAKVDEAESAFTTAEQNVTDIETSLSDAKNSLTSAQKAYDNAETDEEKAAAKIELEAAQKEVSEAEQKLEQAKTERDKSKQALDEAQSDADRIKRQGEQAVQAAQDNVEKVELEGEQEVQEAENNEAEVKADGSKAVLDAQKNKDDVQKEGEENVKSALNLSAENLFDILDSNGDKKIDRRDMGNQPSSFTYMLEDLGVTKENESSYDKKAFKKFLKNSGKSTDDFINTAEQRYYNDFKEDIELKNAIVKENAYSIEHLAELSDRPRIQNSYYTGDYSYQREFGEDSIKITNTDTNEQTTLDISSLLAPFNAEDKAKIKEALKNMPAETLLDLNTEVTFSGEATGKGSGGLYSSVIDKIFLSGGNLSVETVVHELGHAIDARKTSDGQNLFETANENFQSVFNEELNAYKAMGFNRSYTIHKYGSSDVEIETFPTGTGNNYATNTPQEMFAECYTLAMLGHCDSMDTIVRFFPKTFECAKEILAQTRQLQSNQRH